LQPLYSIANLGFANLNEMKTLNHDIRRLKMEKEFAWLMTIALMVIGLPFLKNAVVSILIKLYELLIENVIGK
jgi:hypothetical protein